MTYNAQIIIVKKTPVNFYVDKNATGSGNGTSWANAFRSLPTTLVSNATYYIAKDSEP